jgi:glycerol-3-phosphate dehydrogenase (NAD(P)+)
MNIAVFGAGAWGTALAWHWVNQGHAVTLVPRTLEAGLELAADRVNTRHLPSVDLPLSLQIGWEPAPVLLETEVAILACPSSALRDLARRLQAGRAGAHSWQWVVAVCKGLEDDTRLRPSEILQQELPGLSVAMLSGPSFAHELVQRHPTAITLASQETESKLIELQTALNGDHLRIYRSHDLIGVEMAGALKNPYAIVAGICDGLGLGDNTKAALLTRSLAEMVRIGVASGGMRETFYGLSGVGDLSATFHGKGSRNRTLGEKIGQGITVQKALNQLSGIAEGYRACKVGLELAQAAHVDAPILNALYQVLYQNLPAADALQLLLNRDLKSEI